MSRASSALVGEGGVAELERERRIGEPKGEDREGEVGAGVVLVEKGKASWMAAAGEVGEPEGGAHCVDFREAQTQFFSLLSFFLSLI